MAAVERYLGRFDTQYDGTVLAKENCTPASLSNCIRSATEGKVDEKPSEVRALVKRSEEQNPTTPGWSLGDADLAATRLGVPFDFLKGTWSQAKARRDEGRMLLLQGDSDQFADGTCSGKFDGNHAIAVHPNTNSSGEWLTGDPICQAWRWEKEETLRDYAEKFGGGSVFFGYTSPVPVVEAEVAVVITITPEKGRYTIPAGSSITGLKIDPTTGLVAARKTWSANPKPSSASYDARITTTAFKGNPFLRGVDGYFAGFWISAGVVDEVPTPAPAPDCTSQVAAAKAAGIEEGKALKDKDIATRLGLGG